LNFASPKSRGRRWHASRLDVHALVGDDVRRVGATADDCDIVQRNSRGGRARCPHRAGATGGHVRRAEDSPPYRYLAVSDLLPGVSLRFLTSSPTVFVESDRRQAESLRSRPLDRHRQGAIGVRQLQLPAAAPDRLELVLFVRGLGGLRRNEVRLGQGFHSPCGLRASVFFWGWPAGDLLLPGQG
jgi:hypothetical protein